MSRDLYAHRPLGAQLGAGRFSRRSLFGLGMAGTAREDIDYDGAAERLQAVWRRAGHEPLLRAIEPVADVVAKLAETEPGARVLDVGAGDGNVALACATRGAAVEATDVVPEQVARGRERCGERVEWRRADAARLPHPDGSFDAVVSAFGATLAPDAGRVAAELARVARPGAWVILTAWAPRGLPGGLDEAAERVDPLPEGVPRPSRWGVESVARDRLAPLLDGLELRARSVPLRFESADAAFAAFVGATTVERERRRELRPVFDRLLASCNESPSGVEIRARYLLARGRARAPTGAPVGRPD